MVETERFDQLSVPPVKGRFYLVWCVTGIWYGKIADWPVWGPKHEDGKFLNFPAPHYHLNRYFVDDPRAVMAPLADSHNGRGYLANDPLPVPVLRRRKCVTATPGPFHVWRVDGNWRKMREHFEGAQCKRGIGWICPHKGFDLASVSPGETGHISCPLHGLLIHAETGRVVGKSAT